MSAEAIREPDGPERDAAGDVPPGGPMTLVRPDAARERAGPPDVPVDLLTVLAGVSAGITVQDAAGVLLYANPLAAALAGFDDADEMLRASPGELVQRFQLIDEHGRPFDPTRLPGRRVVQGAVPDPVLLGFRVPGGAERWSMVHARAATLEDGRIVAVNTFHEVTSRIEAERRVRERERRFRQMAEERRRAEDRLESVLRHMPVGVVLFDQDGRVLFANSAARRMSIMAVDVGAIPSGEVRALRPDGSPLERDGWPVPRALAGEVVENEIVSAENDAGLRRTYNLSAAPMRDRDGRIDAAILTILDVTDRVVAQERERFLARASEVLASSLDYEETVRRVADLVVPQFADWCAVHLANEERAPQLIAVAHRDPDKVALALEVARDYPEEPDSPSSAAAILRDGHTVFVPDITEEQLDAAARDDRHREIIRALHLRSALSVPLVVGGRVTGVLTLVNGESGRRFEAGDVAFAENLAARAAAAIENARLFREGVRFKRLLDATSDAVLLLDLESRRIVYANQGAALQFVRPIEELVGATVDEHVDDVGAFALRAAFEALDARTSDARTETVRLRRPVGDAIPVEVRLQLVAFAAEPRRILAVARDLRERIAAEENLRTLAASEHARAAELNAVIRAMGEAVVVCDRDGRIILANPAAEDIFPEVDEATYDDILAELDDPDGRAPRLGSSGGPVELRARRGDDRWIEISTWPVRPDQTSEMREETIVVLRDVSEARQRQAVRDTFIGVLSHELRTPVTTIYAGAKVLSRQGELAEETAREIFSDIVVESERLHRLVEDVVAMTRFGDEGGDVGAEPVLLQRMLPTIVESEQSRWPGVTFRLTVPAGLPTVIADPTYVEQVVRNLLSNAAKYGRTGGAHVDVRVEARDGEVLARILDDGPGFPPDEADRLFELFFRSPRTARTAAGAGIGLFVCSRLIRAMGGRIWAVNRREGGAEFGFSLRVMSEDSQL